MILVLVKRADTFTIDDEYFEFIPVSVFDFNWLRPNPQTLTNTFYSPIKLTFVQGFIVGPTPNPEFCFLPSNIRLSKKDFPVLYFPATATTPTFSLIDFKNSTASGATLNPLM